MEPAGLCGRCTGVAVPLRVVPSPTGLPSPRQDYWSGLPFPSPGDLPNPGIEPRSPALQAPEWERLLSCQAEHGSLVQGMVGVMDLKDVGVRWESGLCWE